MDIPSSPRLPCSPHPKPCLRTIRPAMMRHGALAFQALRNSPGVPSSLPRMQRPVYSLQEISSDPKGSQSRPQDPKRTSKNPRAHQQITKIYTPKQNIRKLPIHRHTAANKKSCTSVSVSISITFSLYIYT